MRTSLLGVGECPQHFNLKIRTDLGDARTLIASLRAEIANLTNELAEARKAYEKLKIHFDKLYAELYGGGDGERIKVCRTIALRMSELHKESERRRIVAEWCRYAQMKKNQRAMGIHRCLFDPCV